jgi:hypothetical protein
MTENEPEKPIIKQGVALDRTTNERMVDAQKRVASRLRDIYIKAPHTDKEDSRVVITI